MSARIGTAVSAAATVSSEGSRARALELIALLLEDSPSLSIVAIGPPGSSELASDARRLGARDFVLRPWDDLRMLALVRAQAELGRSRRRLAALETENRELRSRDVVGAPPPLMKVRQMEEELVQQAIAQHHGNVSRAARTLGLSRTALYRRLARHRIVPSGRRKRGGVAD